jgi:hypothetical protein
MDNPTVESIDPTWKNLYSTGGAAAFIALVFYLSQVLILIFGEPYPATTEGWLNLFSRSKLLGLFYLNALDMASISLFCLMFLALCLALKQVNPSAMAIAAVLSFIGAAVFIATRSVTFAMIPLSDRYAAASTGTQRAHIITIGDAVGIQLQATPRTTGFLLMSIAVLIISISMLHSQTFNKATAVVGIFSSLLVFSLHISVVLAPTISDPLMGVGMLLWIIWLVLVGIRLLQLGKVAS